jgi:hypothetical protein
MQQLLAQQRLLLARVVVRDADQRLVAGRSQAALHRFEQVDEQRVRQQRDQHRDVRAVARRECARRRIGNVAELAGSLLDARHECGVGLTAAARATSASVTRPVARDRGRSGGVDIRVNLDSSWAHYT